MLLDHLNHQLAAIAARHQTRSLRMAHSPTGPRQRVRDAQASPGDERELLMFCSNDYLGLAGHPALAQALAEGAAHWAGGSGASHLISGHTAAHEALEATLAGWYVTEIGRQPYLVYGLLKTAEAVAARYFAGQAASARGFGRVAPAPCAAFEKTVVKHTHQTHCIIGNRAYGIGEEKRLPLALLINILGGPCANSLLNVVVREKNGLSYNIEASYTPYSDSGIVAIYFSSENGNTAQCIDLIEGELHRLRTTPLTARQLSMAKKQFIAQLAISSESNEGYMLGAGKSFLTHDDVDTMEQVYAKVRALTAAQLTEVAEEVFSGMSRLIYK